MFFLTHRKYTEGLEVLGKELNPTFKKGYLMNEFRNTILLKNGASLLFQRTTDLFWFGGVMLRRG